MNLSASRDKIQGVSALSLAILLPIILTLLIFALDMTRMMVVRYILINQVQDIGEQARLETAIKFQQKNLKNDWQQNQQVGFLHKVALTSSQSQYFTKLEDWLTQPNDGNKTPTTKTCCMRLSLTFSTPSLARMFSDKKNWQFTLNRLIYFEGQTTP